MVAWQSLSVLTASPPRFSAEEAATIAAKLEHADLLVAAVKAALPDSSD